MTFFASMKTFRRSCKTEVEFWVTTDKTREKFNLSQYWSEHHYWLNVLCFSKTISKSLERQKILTHFFKQNSVNLIFSPQNLGHLVYLRSWGLRVELWGTMTLALICGLLIESRCWPLQINSEEWIGMWQLEHRPYCAGRFGELRMQHV